MTMAFKRASTNATHYTSAQASVPPHPLVAGVPASTEAVGGQANRTRQVLGFSRIKLHLDKGVKISCLDARKENMITTM